MVEITISLMLQMIQTVGILVGIFYYLMTLRNQNKTRRGQLLMQTYGRIDQPDRIKALSSMMTTWNFENGQQFAEKLRNDPDFLYDFGNITLFMEGLGSMVRLNYIDIDGVAALFGGGITEYWRKIMPCKDEITKVLYPSWYLETELLYNELQKYAKTHPEQLIPIT